jgi:hypothetical protein
MKRPELLILLFLLTLIAIHIGFLINLPDLPFWDDWTLLSDMYGEESSISWKHFQWAQLFDRHNEHFIFPSRAMHSFFYLTGNYSFQLMIFLSFSVYLLALGAYYKLLRLLEFSKVYAMVAIVPFLSTLNIEGIFISVQICVHFLILIYCLGAIVFVKYGSKLNGQLVFLILFSVSPLFFGYGFGLIFGGLAFLIFEQLVWKRGWSSRRTSRTTSRTGTTPTRRARRCRRRTLAHWPRWASR